MPSHVLDFPDVILRQPIFNTQRLLRKKGKDPKNTREDMISLNGRVLEKDADKANDKN